MDDKLQHPYSDVVQVGDLLLLSGCLPVTKNQQLVTGNREALDAALETARRRLMTVGADLTDVAKVTYYVTDIALREYVNQQFCDVWTEPRPARTVISVRQLPRDAIVELDIIAYKPSD